MTTAQRDALRRLKDGPLMRAFRERGSHHINGRVAASLIRFGWAQDKADSSIDIGGGWGIHGPVIEITDAGRAAWARAAK